MTAPPPPHDPTRANLAELRAKGPLYAEVADIMESMLDAAEAQERGAAPILYRGGRFAKLSASLRRKALALFRGTGNDNA